MFWQAVDNPPFCTAAEHCLTSSTWILKFGSVSACKSDGTCPSDTAFVTQNLCCDYVKSSVLSGCTGITAAEVDAFIKNNTDYCSNEKGCVSGFSYSSAKILEPLSTFLFVVIFSAAFVASPI
jgi:hypothetical protein